MNILFLYFGQPRMVEELIPNHDFIAKSLKDDYKINVDFHYSLWNKYHDYRTIPSASSRNIGNNSLIDIDENSLVDKLTKNRQANITYNFNDYNIAESIWKKNKKHIDKETFMSKFAQTVSKAIAVESIKKEYDIIILLRTDLFIDTKKYFVFGDICYNFKKIQEQKEYTILTSYIRHSTTLGPLVDDKFWISNKETFNLYFNNWKDKIDNLLKKRKKISYGTSAHNIACSLSNDCIQDEILFLPFYDIFKYLTPLSRITFTNLFKVVRSFDDVQEMIKNPNFTIEEYKQLTK